MSLNWNIEVFLAFLGFIFFLIFSFIFFILATSKRNKIYLSLAITLSIFTAFHFLEATAYIFISFELKRASAMMYSIGLFSLILNVDLVSKERISYYKSVIASFIIGCTVILALIPENINFYYHEYWGYPTLGVVGFLRIINIFALFLVEFQLTYWFYRTWRKSPPELKRSALNLFITAILFYICILIIFLFGIWLIIPIPYIIAMGFMSLVIYFVYYEPKLIYILSFSAYRITVITNHSGTPLFNLSWNLHDYKSDNEQSLLAKWLPVLHQLSLKFTKSLLVEEIKLENDVLLFRQGSYITAVLLSKKSTPALRESLHNFVRAFEEHYILLLKASTTDYKYYNGTIDLINKFFPSGISSTLNSDNSLKSYLEELVGQRTCELEQVSQIKTEFMSTMSHELRTPLNVIIGFTDLLLEKLYGELNKDQVKFLNNITSSATHLLNLINDILDISKIESGKINLNIQQSKLFEIIDPIIATIKPMYEAKDLKFNIQGLNKEQIIAVDPIRFKEILYNLLSNAIKYILQGEISLNIKDSEKYWKFDVIDTGIGILKKDYHLIFKDFQRIDSKYIKSIEGTGLGLSFSKRLVNLHGGDIWFKSIFKKGSTFSFTIPKNAECKEQD